MEIIVNVEKIDLSAAEGMFKGNEFGLYMAYVTHRLYKPYVPFDTGTLRDTVSYEPYKIIHDTEYAHYMYEGKVYGPNYPRYENGFLTGFRSPAGKGTKSPTGKEIKYSNPIACAHWEEKVKAKDLAQEVIAYVKHHI